MGKLISLFVLIFLLQGSLYTQSWLLPAGSFDILASYSAINYDAIYNSQGEITDFNGFELSDQTIQVIGRYGLLDRLTLQAHIPYKIAKRFSEGSGPDIQTLHDFGNVETGVVYQYIESIPYLTASFFVEANTSDYNFINGLATGYNSWAFQPGLSYIAVYNNLWTSMYTGVEFRTNNYSNNFLLNMESGYQAMESIYLAVNLYLRQSFANGDYCDCGLDETGMYADKQEYFGAGVKAGFQIQNIGFHFAINTAFTAQNVGAAPAVTAGISYRSYN